MSTRERADGDVEGALLHSRPAHERTVAQADDRQPVDLFHAAAHRQHVEEIGHDAHADELVVEIGEDLLEQRRFVARQRNHDLVDTMFAQDALQLSVAADHGNATGHRSAGRTRQHAEHAQAGLGTRAKTLDETLHQIAGTDAEHVALVVATSARAAGGNERSSAGR